MELGIGGADHSNIYYVEKLPAEVTKLKSQQAGFAVDAEIKSEMIVVCVVKLGALSNFWNPVFQKLHMAGLDSGITPWEVTH